MGKSLVIVESPAKAKTINKYLGSDFIVKSSMGHIRDLPTGGSATRGKRPKVKVVGSDPNASLINRMGVDPYRSWQANYEILPGKEKIVSELKSAAAKVDYIYLATDLDREGEAIAWHLREVIGGDQQRYRRVVFNEITRNAICQAFESPTSLNIARVQAQQARRFLDRVVGFMVSPLLWKKIARGLSAGRVQSVAVRLVVERERNIKAFLPEEYWELHAGLTTADSQELRLQVVQLDEKPFKPTTESDVQRAITQLEVSGYVVADCEVKPTSSKPPAPFITSTLQQAASTRLGFGVKKTMMTAQKLYESGYITYMRTDSTNLSQEALDNARKYVGGRIGENYLPKEANQYSSKGNAQEAHEAIRPSDVFVESGDLNGVDADAKKLYQLIWRQFVACQMVPARYLSTTITVKSGPFLLKTKGMTLEFDGWTKVMPPVRRQDEILLPKVEVGGNLQLHNLEPSQHFTKPPARYNEASLVRELEKQGIGRPSTYAAIISTIQERGYVRSDNRRFYAEKMGEIVTDRLVQSFQGLMSYDFTAQMETILDDIAMEKIGWKSVLDQFFSDFSAQLEVAGRDPGVGGMKQTQMALTEIKCNSCGNKMVIRTASTGVFLGCSGYSPGANQSCKNTINLIPVSEVMNLLPEGEAEAETAALRARRRCSSCGTAMDSYWLEGGGTIHICGNNPSCAGYLLEEGVEKKDQLTIPCDKCGANLQLKTGRFGKYMGCSNQECHNTRKILASGEIAPPKEDPIPLPELRCSKSDAYYVLRNGASGLFLAANTFPKSRESRSPLVSELHSFRDRLPEKLHYLADAPLSDPAGNPTVVKFSRKTKEQYIASEKGDKATGWLAFYRNEGWVAKGG